MTMNEIRTSIQTVYEMLWEVLAIYEETDCYNTVPKGEEEEEIWHYMGTRLLVIRKKIDTLFLGRKELREQLNRIVDETEQFVRSYEKPGVVTRWKQLNPQILFFDYAFELMEECPDIYRKISWGPSELRLSCYPDETLVEARKRYFQNLKKKMEEGNLRYTENTLFQMELLRTLTLVFEYDFGMYLR